jgi:hypothetical protein
MGPDIPKIASSRALFAFPARNTRDLPVAVSRPDGSGGRAHDGAGGFAPVAKLGAAIGAEGRATQLAKYSLQPNEVVLLKDESVMHGGLLSAFTDELMLTNLNLVLIKKGVFGNTKGILTFPINQVKVLNKQAQAVVGKSSNGMAVLDVYLLNGQEQFRFQRGGKKKIQTWIANINQAVTGQEIPDTGRTAMALPGSELVAGVLKDTYSVFRAKLGPQAGAPVKVASKCGSCGAPIAGNRGDAITCEYCGSTQQL